MSGEALRRAGAPGDAKPLGSGDAHRAPLPIRGDREAREPPTSPITGVSCNDSSGHDRAGDALVDAREFRNRSQAIEAALADALARRARTRLATECAKLDPREERALAEEGTGAEAWPED